MDTNRHFSKGNILMGKRHMKRCSTSLINKEMQIKPQRDTISHLSGWLLSKREATKRWQGCGEIGTLAHCRWEWKIAQRFLKIKNIN